MHIKRIPNLNLLYLKYIGIIKFMKKIEVVAGIIRNGDYILCCQRGYNKLSYLSEKWEFPGGKIEPNESLMGALARELKEELGIKISSSDNLEYS